MKVLANNCVSTIAVPMEAYCGGKVAYNPVLKLFVTMGEEYQISVWSPETGKVIHLAHNPTEIGGLNDMVMAPRNHVVLSFSESHPPAYDGGSVEIYSLEKLSFNSEPKPVLTIKDLLPMFPGMIALSPHNSLLVLPLYECDVWDISIDWDKLQDFEVTFLKNDSYLELYYRVDSLCCTPDYSVVAALSGDECGARCVIVCYRKSSPKEDQSNKDGENNENKEEEQYGEKEVTVVEEQIEEEQIEEELDTTLPKNDDNSDSVDGSKTDRKTDRKNVIDGGVIRIKGDLIDHYILDGLEYKLNGECKLIHDGENLLVYSADKIILLETLTNGSKAHLVVSGLPKTKDLHAKQGLGINHKGQLMVCDDENSIKIYEYRCIPRSLQDLCRCCISEAIPSSYQESINKLPLPATVKDYLLFKDLGY